MKKEEAINWAWLAGVFEGEGCISFQGKNQVVIKVQMSDFDVVRRCHEISGRGLLNGPYLPRGSRKSMLTWAVNKADDVEFVLRRMLPYLGERRSIKALGALERTALIDRRCWKRVA